MPDEKRKSDSVFYHPRQHNGVTKGSADASHDVPVVDEIVLFPYSEGFDDPVELSSACFHSNVLQGIFQFVQGY